MTNDEQPSARPARPEIRSDRCPPRSERTRTQAPLPTDCGACRRSWRQSTTTDLQNRDQRRSRSPRRARRAPAWRLRPKRRRSGGAPCTLVLAFDENVKACANASLIGGSRRTAVAAGALTALIVLGIVVSAFLLWMYGNSLSTQW